MRVEEFALCYDLGEKTAVVSQILGIAAAQSGDKEACRPDVGFK